MMRHDVPVLLAFCRAHPASRMEPGLLARLLTDFTTFPGGAVVVEEDGALALVASVGDRLTSASRCAVVDLIGLRTPRPAALLPAALAAAERHVRGGERVGIEVTLGGAHAPLGEIAAACGYQPAFRSYRMETAPLTPERPPLPGVGWRWVAVDAALAGDYHAIVSATMAAVPGSYIPDRGAVQRAVLAAPGQAWLLLDGAQPAAFCRVRVGPDGWGEVELIGRHPQRRGAGLGEQALGQAMTLLAARGARRFRLEVVAENRAALALYRRHGFGVAAEAVTWRKRWAPPQR